MYLCTLQSKNFFCKVLCLEDREIFIVVHLNSLEFLQIQMNKSSGLRKPEIRSVPLLCSIPENRRVLLKSIIIDIQEIHSRITYP